MPDLERKVDAAHALADRWEAEHVQEWGEEIAAKYPSYHVTQLREALNS